MKITHDGLLLWCGTSDAPAPRDDEVVPSGGTSIVVGVRPPNPTNVVSVRYRVDDGVVQTVPGREVRVDHGNEVQYFAATFPAFPNGEVVH